MNAVKVSKMSLEIGERYIGDSRLPIGVFD